MRKLRRFILIILGTLLILMLGIHLILTYRAKELLQEVVSELSHGEYKLRAGKVNLYYLQGGFEAHHIELIPDKPGKQETSLKMEFVSVRLGSILQLLKRKSLVVTKIDIQKPEIVTFAKNKSGSTKKNIAAAIQQVKDKLFSFLHSLKIENLDVSDASLLIHPPGLLATRFFYINHINLSFRNIEMTSSRSGIDQPVHLEGKLRLEHPNISIADSTIQLNIGRLEADFKNHNIQIDSLGFLQHDRNGKPQNIRLASVKVSKYNWQKYFDEGLLEADSLLASSGIVELNLPDIKKKDSAITKKTVKDQNGLAISLHHTMISNITYRLGTQSPYSKKPGRVVLKLEGDSLYMKNLSLLQGRDPFVMLDQLGLSIRDYSESENADEYHSSFQKLSIDSRALLLSNALFETNKTLTDRSHIRISIPHLRIHEYNLEELFRKRLSASSVTLENPDFTLDTRLKKNDEPKKKKAVNETINQLTGNAANKLYLRDIIIKNGNFTLLPSVNREDQVKLTGLSLELDVRKLNDINNMTDLIHSIRKLNSNGFSIVGKNLNLRVSGIRLLKNPAGLHFASVDGSIGKGQKLHLDGVTVSTDFTQRLNPEPGLFFLSGLSVDSGYVMIDQTEINLSKSPSSGRIHPAIAIAINQFDLNKFRVKLNKGSKVAVSGAMDLFIRDFVFRNGQLNWTTLDMLAEGSQLRLNNSHAEAVRLQASQPGVIRLIRPSVQLPGNRADIYVLSDSADFGIDLNSTRIDSLTLGYIRLHKPLFRIEKHAVASDNKVYDSTESRQAIIPKFLLRELRLNDPAVLFIDPDSTKAVRQIESYEGSMILGNIQSTLKDGRQGIRADSFRYTSATIHTNYKNIPLKPASVHVVAGDIWFDPAENDFSARIDSIMLIKIQHALALKNGDSLHIRIGSAGVKQFYFHKKNTVPLIEQAKTAAWWVNDGNMDYESPKKRIRVQGLSANRSGTITLSIDSLSVLNKINRDSFIAANTYEAPYDSLLSGKITMTDIRYQDSGKQPVFFSHTIRVEDMHYTTERDKSKLEDTILFRPLLAQLISRIPVAMKVDSLLISRGRVDVYEISKTTGQRSHLFFDNISGTVSNLKNHGLTETDSLHVKAKALFFGTGKVKLQFHQSYTDSLSGFRMMAKMGKFTMPTMNRLLSPMTSLKILSGQIDSLSLNVLGNDYFAYGTMDLRYASLRVRMLKTALSKNKFKISLMNLLSGILIRKRDNGRTDPLFKERLRKRSQFNFWGKIMMEGWMGNIGLRRNKKEMRQFRDAVKRYKLPANYWIEED